MYTFTNRPTSHWRGGAPDTIRTCDLCLRRTQDVRITRAFSTLDPFERTETKRETSGVMRTRRGHQEKASAAPRKKSGWWWPYTRCSVSGVISRYPAASQSGTPRCISQVAHVCRKTCGVTFSSFARSQAEEKPLLISFNLEPFSFMTKPRSEPRKRARRRCPRSLRGMGWRARRFLERRSPGALKSILAPTKSIWVQRRDKIAAFRCPV